MKASVKSIGKRLAAAVLVLALLTVYFLWADKALTVRTFEIADAEIPAELDGFSIVHVSDLHNALFGEDNIKLLDKIKAAEPDIIAVTGDIVDSRRTNTAISKAFVEKALEIAPVYYVSGNHESRIDGGKAFISQIEELGVTVLDNESVTVGSESGEITLCGISDPAFSTGSAGYEEAFVAAHHLEAVAQKKGFTLLLSHRPEFFELYAEYGFKLVLSGHAHGGQFRLPLVGGFIAPGQGLFPEYDSGLYEQEDTKMLVSRGLGNSIIPLRIFNRPEIIHVILKAAKR